MPFFAILPNPAKKATNFAPLFLSNLWKPGTCEKNRETHGFPGKSHLYSIAVSFLKICMQTKETCPLHRVRFFMVSLHLPALHAGLELGAGHGLVGQEELHHLEELLPVILKQLLAVGIGPVNDGPNFPIQEACHLLGVGFGPLIAPANEDFFIAAIGDGAKLLAHAVFRNHVSGNLGNMLDILGSACGNILAEQRTANWKTGRG